MSECDVMLFLQPCEQKGLAEAHEVDEHGGCNVLGRLPLTARGQIGLRKAVAKRHILHSAIPNWTFSYKEFLLPVLQSPAEADRLDEEMPRRFQQQCSTCVDRSLSAESISRLLRDERGDLTIALGS